MFPKTIVSVDVKLDELKHDVKSDEVNDDVKSSARPTVFEVDVRTNLQINKSLLFVNICYNWPVGMPANWGLAL